MRPYKATWQRISHTLCNLGGACSMKNHFAGKAFHRWPLLPLILYSVHAINVIHLLKKENSLFHWSTVHTDWKHCKKWNFIRLSSFQFHAQAASNMFQDIVSGYCSWKSISLVSSYHLILQKLPKQMSKILNSIHLRKIQNKHSPNRHFIEQPNCIIREKPKLMPVTDSVSVELQEHKVPWLVVLEQANACKI